MYYCITFLNDMSSYSPLYKAKYNITLIQFIKKHVKCNLYAVDDVIIFCET